MSSSEARGAEDTVTVSRKEYDDMQDRLRWLDALEEAGVDNWGGIDFAHELRAEAEAEGAAR